MISNTQSPLIVSAAAASKLPRWALLIVLATYALACFTGHNFWNPRDDEMFGVMWNMASGSARDWFMPAAAGFASSVSAGGAWLGAALMRFLSPAFSPLTLAWYPNLLWFAVATASVWYGTWYLARREEALPLSLSLAAGSEASPRDYSRTIADSAALFFVATFGIFARIHEIGLPVILLAVTAATLCGLACSLVHVKRGAVITGLALGAAFLCTNFYWFLMLLLTALAALFCMRAFRQKLPVRVFIALSTAALTAAVLPAGAVLSGASFAEWKDAWLTAQSGLFSAPGVQNIVWTFRNFVWFLCPAWPFAVYAVYAWHRVNRRTQITLPLIAAAIPAAFLVFSGSSAEFSFIAVTAPAAVLAAFGNAAIRKRSAKNLLDWFSATIFTLAALGLWAYWLAWHFGYPPKMAASVRRLAPNTLAWMDGAMICCTVAVTLLWGAAVVWRLKNRPKALWRGPWLAALGITLIWVLGTALFAPMLNEFRSYTPVAHEIAAKLRIFGYRASDCVRPDGVPLGVTGLLDYKGVRVNDSDACRFTVSRVRAGEALPEDKIGIPTVFPKNGEQYVIRPGKAALLDEAPEKGDEP